MRKDPKHAPGSLPAGRAWALALALAAMLLLPHGAAWAGAINAEDGLALKGYDAVAYFTDRKAVEGSPEFEHQWMGVKWRFASAAHRDAFAASPEAYAPQYGGYCAYAVAKGGTADADPQAWRVVNDKLYVNLSKPVQLLWQADVPGNIAKADANWPTIEEGLAQ